MVSIHLALWQTGINGIYQLVCTGYLYGRCDVDDEFRNILPREVLEYSYVSYALRCRNPHLEARKNKLLEGCALVEMSSMFTIALPGKWLHAAEGSVMPCILQLCLL